MEKAYVWEWQVVSTTRALQFGQLELTALQQSPARAENSRPGPASWGSGLDRPIFNLNKAC